MRLRLRSVVLASLFIALAVPLVQAQVPNLIPHQGRVAVNGVNFDGTGQFKFALVNAAGTTTYWSNNGSSTAGSQPTAAVSLPVSRGLYSVLLGDTALANMTVVPASVYANADLRLRVWFNNGTVGFQQLTPDQRLAPGGYLPDAAVSSAKLADGAVGTAKLADSSITSAKIAPGAVSQLAASDGSPLTALHVNADGQVGIGTTDPLAGLHITTTRNSPAFDLASVLRDETGGFTALAGAWDVATSGSLVAVASTIDKAVTLLDVANPAAPVLRAQIRDGENGFNYLDGAWKLSMKPGLVGVAADLDDAVTLINVANPSSPVKLAELRDGVAGFTRLDTPRALAISGNLLAVGGLEGVTLVDITNPSAPVVRAELVNGAGGYTRLRSIEGIALSGTLLAIGSLSEGVTLVDVTTPAAPVRRAELVTNAPGYEDLRRMTGMSLSGGLLAVASQPTDAVFLIDVSNPASPVRRALLKPSTHANAPTSPVAVALAGTQLLIGGRGSVSLWDISIPSTPTIVGGARQNVAGITSLPDCWGVAFAGTSFVATSQSPGIANVFVLGGNDSSLTTAGWAGFGTTRPEAMLHVVGDVRADGAERVEFNTSRFEVGEGAAANGIGSSALGFGAQAEGDFSFAAGREAWASGAFSVAIGGSAIASAPYSLALGRNARSFAEGGVALGESEASGRSATAIGGSRATGNYSFATGFLSSATGFTATAMGSTNLASGAGAMALGLAAQATHDNSFVWSAGSPEPIFGSTGTNQFLIQAPGGVGINTNAPAGAALAVHGNIRVTGNINATGSLSGNGAGLTGLNAASLTGSVPAASLTSLPAANLTGSVPAASLTAVPAAALTGTINAGSLPSAAALRTTANAFTGNQSITGNLSANGSIAFGPSSSASGIPSFAMGNNASAAGNHSVALGQSAATTAGAGNSIALGSSVTAAHAGSFIWADGTQVPRTTTATNQFSIHAAGGVTINSSGDFSRPQLLLSQTTPGDWSRLRLQSNGPAWDIALGPGATPVMNFFNGSSNILTLEQDGDGRLQRNLSFGTDSLRQMIDLWNGEHAIGVQSWTTYFRTIGTANGGFAWYRGGSHADGQYDPGDGERLMTLNTGGLTVRGTFVSSSDRARKQAIRPVNHKEVLERVAAMPVSRWAYKDDPDTPHIGPMAQDFHAAFGTGPDDKHIAMVDADGVALAAIKGLNEKLQDELAAKDAEIEALRRQGQSMEARLAALETTLRQLSEDSASLPRLNATLRQPARK